jgi:hypothetical protein
MTPPEARSWSLWAPRGPVTERREPIGRHERTRVSGVPCEANHTLAELICAKLWIVGAIARNHVDVAVVGDRWGRIIHTPAPPPAPAPLLGIAAPHVCRSTAASELGGDKRNEPTRRAPLSFAAAERDDHSPRAARFGNQRETCPLHLPVPVKAGPADVVPVDEHRAELVVAQARHVEAK